MKLEAADLPAPMADGFPGERLTILSPAVLRRAKALPGSRGLCVTHTGRFDHVRGHSVVRPHGRPEHVLILCLKGAGRGHLDGAGWSLHGGQGVVLPPQLPHDYAADPANPWTLIWFHFAGTWAEEYARIVGGAGRHRKFSVHQIEVLIEAFEDCYRHVLGGYTDSDLIGLSTSFAHFLGLCRTSQRPADPRRRHTEDRVLRTIRFMRENLSRPISLEELARAAGLSIPHYSTTFKRQMNCSPIEFLTRLRLQKACERIEATCDTIAQIGYAVGFNDPLYFSRVFRRHMSIPASEYRQRGSLGRRRPEST
ncbi:MAG: AraC family transcriptional regulator [Opitutae bacterium]|nr:AraC family transcriptional regulator [Opitutae bacterium]